MSQAAMKIITIKLGWRFGQAGDQMSAPPGHKAMHLLAHGYFLSIPAPNTAWASLPTSCCLSKTQLLGSLYSLESQSILHPRGKAEDTKLLFGNRGKCFHPFLRRQNKDCLRLWKVFHSWVK